ncbi:alpha-ketoglutarate-dependent dioxygenase AlkB [Rhodobacteraceae bacterium SC52]|nr:alpha-ketoglutarate-dependent dioxygenase AlkB [Rhodobacteraceae bacterium SC52]
MRVRDTRPHVFPLGAKETAADHVALDLGGVRVLPGFLGPQAQANLVQSLRLMVESAPLLRQTTRRGQQLSVRMTAAGAMGWVSDQRGYRYEPNHPNGHPWPPVPDQLLEIWAALVPEARAPQSCLVNFYGEGARMGLHQDRDEADMSQPVVSLSLGDDGLFRVGGTTRKAPTQSAWLKSGDAAVLEGPSRLAFHGVDRIRFKSSKLLHSGGRINITMRVVT